MMTEEEADALLTHEALEILRTPAPCELQLPPPRTTRCATCQLVDLPGITPVGRKPSCFGLRRPPTSGSTPSP